MGDVWGIERVGATVTCRRVRSDSFFVSPDERKYRIECREEQLWDLEDGDSRYRDGQYRLLAEEPRGFSAGFAEGHYQCNCENNI